MGLNTNKISSNWKKCQTYPLVNSPKNEHNPPESIPEIIKGGGHATKYFDEAGIILTYKIKEIIGWFSWSTWKQNIQSQLDQVLNNVSKRIHLAQHIQSNELGTSHWSI